jgi:hypothetical protein
MSLLLWIAAVVGPPDLSRLGADDFRVREAEGRRCESLWMALLLPARHDDPEIDFRVKEIRRRQFARLDAANWERRLHAEDFREWLRVCVVEGDSRAYSRMEVFLELRGSAEKARCLMDLTGPGRGPGSFEGSLPGWLVGTILPGEFDCFCDHLDYHKLRAPLPHSK